jgi:hypothetical protein
MVPIKGIVGYGRNAAFSEIIVVTQHRGSLNESKDAGSPK